MAFNTGRKESEGTFGHYSESSPDSESLIGESLVIEGEINSEEPLVIRGKVKGNIHVARRLVVEASGKVSGDLDGKEIIIHGNAKGKVTSAEKLVITSSGTFIGDISAQKLVIEEGARFQGNVDMNTPPPQAPPQTPPMKTEPAKTPPKS